MSEPAYTLTTDQLRDLVREAVREELRDRPSTVTPLVVDSEEAARLLDLPVDTLRKRVRDGKVPALKDGGLLRFRVADLEGYVESLRKGGAG